MGYGGCLWVVGMDGKGFQGGGGGGDPQKDRERIICLDLIVPHMKQPGSWVEFPANGSQ